jgi:protein-S-isoprenylcysteine O-methyltransferase Ste14
VHVCPPFVDGFELAAPQQKRQPAIAPLLAWGYLQYRLVGNHRSPRAGGNAGMDAMPQRIIVTGPYRYAHNPMYFGHIIRGKR